jgi:hypothetical protein
MSSPLRQSMHPKLAVTAAALVLAIMLAACAHRIVAGYVDDTDRYPGSSASKRAEAACRAELPPGTGDVAKADLDACMLDHGWRYVERSVPLLGGVRFF